MSMSSPVARRLTLDRRTTLEIGFIAAVLATLFAVQVGLYGLAPHEAAASHPPSLSQTQAITVARTHVRPDDRFVSADAGPFTLLVPSERVGPDNMVGSDEQVWAVTFSSRDSPSAGSKTVILDKVTGDWITTITFEPTQ